MKHLLLLLLILTSTTLSQHLPQDNPHPLDSALSELFSLCDTDSSSDLSDAELASCGLSYLSTAVKYTKDKENSGGLHSRQQIAKALSSFSSQGGDDPRELAMNVRGEWLDRKMSRMKSYLGGAAKAPPLIAGNGTEGNEKTVERFFQMFDGNRDGLISRIEVKEAEKSLAGKINDKDLETSFKILDKNQDGGISREEFLHFLTSQETSGLLALQTKDEKTN